MFRQFKEKIGHPIRTLIILIQDKNTLLKLPVGVSALQIYIEIGDISS
jgi:hypothetical protein